MRAKLDRRTVTMVLALGTVLGLALQAPPVTAAESERDMKWQASIPITFTSGATFDGEAGTSVDISDDIGFGFGFGYNLDHRFLVGAEFTWLSANYDASVATDTDLVPDGIPDSITTIGGTLDAANIQFLGQWNILAGRITPFLRASFGWTWVDSNIPSGPTQGVCWWDPWYGYICNSWQPTFEDTSFSYGAAAGVRGELTERFFIEGSYNLLWIDFDKAGTQDFDGFRFNMGWVF